MPNWKDHILCAYSVCLNSCLRNAQDVLQLSLGRVIASNQGYLQVAMKQCAYENDDFVRNRCCLLWNSNMAYCMLNVLPL